MKLKNKIGLIFVITVIIVGVSFGLWFIFDTKSSPTKDANNQLQKEDTSEKSTALSPLVPFNSKGYNRNKANEYVQESCKEKNYSDMYLGHSSENLKSIDLGLFQRILRNPDCKFTVFDPYSNNFSSELRGIITEMKHQNKTTSLDFSHLSYDDEATDDQIIAFMELMKVPGNQISTLNLYHTRISGAVVLALAEVLKNPNNKLEYIDLSRNYSQKARQPGPSLGYYLQDLADAMVESSQKGYFHVKRLDLSANQLGGRGFKQLTDAFSRFPQGVRLEELNYTNNEHPNDLVQYTGNEDKPKQNIPIDRLILTANRWHTNCWNACTWLALSDVKTLDLALLGLKHNRLHEYTPSSVRHVTSPNITINFFLEKQLIPWLYTQPSLEKLALNHNNIDDSSMHLISEILSHNFIRQNHIEYLNLSGNEITDKGIEELYTHLDNDGNHVLPRLDDEERKLHHLKTLLLGGNPISYQSLKKLLKIKTIEELDFSGTNLSEGDLEDFSKLLEKEGGHLRHIDLSNIFNAGNDYDFQVFMGDRPGDYSNKAYIPLIKVWCTNHLNRTPKWSLVTFNNNGYTESTWSDEYCKKITAKTVTD